MVLRLLAPIAMTRRLNTNNDDPDDKQNVADLVDVESRGLYGGGEPKDGSDDREHDSERH